MPIYRTRIEFRVRYISDISEFDISIYRSYDISINRNFRYKIQHTICSVGVFFTLNRYFYPSTSVGWDARVALLCGGLAPGGWQYAKK